MKKQLTILSISMLTVLGGCKKYLDVKSDAKLVVPSKLSDIQGVLDDADYMNLSRTPSLGESMSDDIFLPPTTLNGRDLTTKLIYTWQKFDYRFGNDWSSAYVPIYNSNLCLELLEKIPRTNQNAAAWDNAKGSALFFRAYYFYQLTTQYGKGYGSSSDTDLGIVLRLSSDFNVKSHRSSVKACFEQILSDCEQALNLLPINSTHSFRPSKAAAYAFLSRVYLYMHDYQKVQTMAEECLKIKSTLMDFNSDSDILGLTLNVTFRRFNKETIFYSEQNTFSDISIPLRARTDTVLYASYNLNDLRRTAYFRTVSGFQQFKGSYASNANILFSGLATDEIILNKAEAKSRLGDFQGAMTDLNQLLKSRWRNTVPYVPISATDSRQALDFIIKERRKELIMRGIRFSDLKRLNEQGANITLTRMMDGKPYNLLPKAAYYAIPLPTDIIEQTGIDQN
ncbi:RagB/SusD family nutrient uptake outer membrane protein [Pedobacter sp. MW01-1-1]|uniref:RagB/SusD family nutrient uptake outer membrane protein n=1 Tax=Pedobacter sp. MW01-1-1 TaxID=3383027 RepID=UPI003FED59D9